MTKTKPTQEVMTSPSGMKYLATLIPAGVAIALEADGSGGVVRMGSGTLAAARRWVARQP